MHQIRAGAMMMDLAIESLERAGVLRLRLNGASMIPTIYPGSYAVIRRAGVHEVQPGDIILTRFEEGVRLHRLTRVQHTGSSAQLITRGDNHAWNDAPCPADHLLGVLVKIEDGPPILARWRIRARQLARVLARRPA